MARPRPAGVIDLATVPVPGPPPPVGARPLDLEPDECLVFGCPRLARLDAGYPMCPECSERYHYGDGAYRGPALQLDLIRAICGRVGNCWEPRLFCGARGYTRIRWADRHWPLHRLAAVLDCHLQCGPADALAADPRRMVLHDVECEYLYRRGLLRRRCCNPAHLRWGDPDGSARENADDILRAGLMLEAREREGLSDLEVYRRHGAWCDWASIERDCGGVIESPPGLGADYDLARALGAALRRSAGEG